MWCSVWLAFLCLTRFWATRPIPVTQDTGRIDKGNERKKNIPDLQVLFQVCPQIEEELKYCQAVYEGPRENSDRCSTGWGGGKRVQTEER